MLKDMAKKKLAQQISKVVDQPLGDQMEPGKTDYTNLNDHFK